MARLKSGRFAPGESGNPSGRPKQTQEQADAMEQIKALAPEAVAEMRRLLLAEETPSALKVRIAEAVLDRVYGKPQQSCTVRQYPLQDAEIVICGEIEEALEERAAERKEAEAE